VTNQDIAASADDLRTELRRDHGLFLDIRDLSWFLDTAATTTARDEAAEELAAEVVDPLMARRSISGGQGQALTSVEAQSAFVYLEMQLADESREKGLTRLSFEALVKAVLRDTDSDSRKARGQIHDEVAALVPGHDPVVVERYTDAALTRLNKKKIRHWTKLDEFCMTHEEATRLAGRRIEVELEDRRLQTELERSLDATAEVLKVVLPTDRGPVVSRLRRVLEIVLLARGEEFVSAVQSESLESPSDGEIRQKVVADVGSHPDHHGLKGDLVPLLTASVNRLLRAPGADVAQHIRSLADTYTLFAFLRETPDVQSAVRKMFSHGEVWLDTNIVLSLLAETLVPEENRTFSRLATAATESGLLLRLTEGVLEEVDAHANLCLTYARHDERTNPWRGRVPFLFASFALTGRPKGEFAGWLENFRGSARPEDDIAEYLGESFAIKVESLGAEVDEAPQSLRAEIKEIWFEAHSERRRGQDMDPTLVHTLAEHDVENYLGVLQRRRHERKSAFGYSSWWLTLDRTAYGVGRELKKRLDGAVPSSPVMSADFLSGYLAFGPNRRRLTGSLEKRLPLSAEVVPLDLLPPELLEYAEQVRSELDGLPERIVNRRIRDSLDAARSRLGTLAQGGMEVRLDDLKAALRDHVLVGGERG
jgi:hypothetical protein